MGLEWQGSGALPEAGLGGGGNGKLITGEVVAACRDWSRRVSWWGSGRQRSVPGRRAGEPGGVRGHDPGSEVPKRARFEEAPSGSVGPEPTVVQPPGFFHGGQSVVREQL